MSLVTVAAVPAYGDIALRLGLDAIAIAALVYGIYRPRHGRADLIVESKSRRGAATADRELRSLGARPESVCSNYCLGIGFTNPDVKSNRLLPLLRRHFHAAPAADLPDAA